jgi:hypothetical protein
MTTSSRAEVPDCAEQARRGAAGPVKETVAVVGTWLVGALVTFRASVFHGFGPIVGNRGDGRLLGLLHEHWLDVVRGRAAWRTPTFFHPMSNTLGYSDTMVLNEVFYAPLRAVGFDRYAALQLTMILLTLVGFVGWYLVGTRLVAAPRSLVLALALVAVFANSLYVQLLHMQMLSIHWVPWLVLLIARVWRADRLREQLPAAAAAGALFGLLLWSTYYIAWFAAFVGGLIAVAVAVRCRRSLRAVGVRGVLDRGWRPALAATAGAALPIAGFLFTYLPTIQNSGSRSFDDAYHYSPGPADLLNVGRGNLLWGRGVEVLLGTRRADNPELASAVTPLVVLALLACAVALFRHRRSSTTTTSETLAQVLVGVTLVLPLLSVHIGAFTPWRLVWLVPGASGLRAIGRIQLIAAWLAPMAMLCTIVSVRRQRQAVAMSRSAVAAVVLTIGLLVVEQCNTASVAKLDRAAELAFIRHTPAPPAECESFFLLTSPTGFYFELDLDAMIIAQTHRLPTLNGYSGAEPPGWRLRHDKPDYLANVQSWVRLHGLRHVCSYDATTKRWTVDAVQPPAPTG